MADVLLNGRIERKDQFLFLNQQNIIGAQSIEIHPNLALSPLKYLGMGGNNFTPYPSSDTLGTISIDYLLLNNDPFINYTGDSLINGYILRSPSDFTNNYSFLSGFLTSYRCEYSINQIPKVSTQWSIANDLGNLSFSQLNYGQQNDINNIATGTYVTGNTIVSNLGSISLNIGDFTTNRLQSFDIAIDCNKVPIYNMGNKYPARIQLLNPLNVTCTFTFEVGDYQFLNKKNFPQTIKNNNLNLQISGAWGGNLITSYSFNNLNLMDESYSINVDNNTLMSTVIYKSFI